MFFVGQVSGLIKNFYMGIFSNAINVINVNLCTLVLLIELYLFIPFSMILTIFQGHSNVKHFKLKILCSYEIKLKLDRIIE